MRHSGIASGLRVCACFLNFYNKYSILHCAIFWRICQLSTKKTSLKVVLFVSFSVSLKNPLIFFIVCVDLNISINAPTIFLEDAGVTSYVNERIGLKKKSANCIFYYKSFQQWADLFSSSSQFSLKV
jgi:hypothetical protein